MFLKIIKTIYKKKIFYNPKLKNKFKNLKEFNIFSIPKSNKFNQEQFYFELLIIAKEIIVYKFE